jgi:hypothetical protein
MLAEVTASAGFEIWGITRPWRWRAHNATLKRRAQVLAQRRARHLKQGSGFFQPQRFLGNFLGSHLRGLAASMEDRALVVADRPAPSIKLLLLSQGKTRDAGVAAGDLERRKRKAAAHRGAGGLVIRA